MTVYVSDYEWVMLVALRMQQIHNGATPHVHFDYSEDTRAIVLREIREHRMPLVLERRLPDGTTSTHGTRDFDPLSTAKHLAMGH